MNRVVCYACGQPGHIIRNCPNRNNSNGSNYAAHPTINNNNQAPQPKPVNENDNNESLQINRQIQQLLAQLVPQEDKEDQSLN